MKCPQCASNDVDRLDGTLVCTQCGHVLGESEIVNDVSFAENSAGAATVQGTQVNASGRHTMVGPRGRMYGDGDSRAQTMLRADTAIRGLCRRLGVESVQLHQMAIRIYQLALNIGQGATPFLNPVTNEVSTEGGHLIHGRKAEYSHGACVYLALRRAKVPIMLIEVADAVKVNVFVLGRAYLRLTSILRFDPDQRDLSLTDPSIYIRRFAKMLDFGDDEDKGRRPSGITGACLLIAARMNNFRRSVAEIVQVVKVADTTLKRRLDEFRDSKAGSMSINEFREMWDAPAENDALPPSAVRNRKKEAEDAQKKQAQEAETDAEDEDSDAEVAPDVNAGPDVAAIDRHAGAIESQGKQNMAPEIEVQRRGSDPQLEDQLDGAIAGEVQQFLDSNLLRSDLDEAIQAQNERERRARMTAAERAQQTQHTHQTTGPTEETRSMTHTASAPEHSSQHFLESSQATAVPSQIVTGPQVSAHKGLGRELQESPADRPRKRRRKSKRHVLPKEDKGDPLAGLDEDELDGYLLDEEEQAMKERVWTELNKEYLQQALVKALKEEENIKRGLPPDRRRRRGGRVLRDATNAMGTSAADAATKMVQARQFSQKINYAALGNMFPGAPGGVGRGGKGKRRASEADEDDLDDHDPDGLGAAMDYVEEDALDRALGGKHHDRSQTRTRHASVGVALSEGGASGAESDHGVGGLEGDDDDVEGYEQRDEDATWNDYDA